MTKQMGAMQLPHLSKKVFGILGLILVIAATRYGYTHWSKSDDLPNPGGRLSEIISPPRPYEKYSFEALAARPAQASKIEIGKEISKTDNYTSYVFYYTGDGRRISGMLTIPNLSRQMAAIIMARGYTEKEGYKTGLGTKNAAQYYASKGYITLAPDFSGYGESEPEDENALGARLRKPVEIIDLLASLKSLPQIDPNKIYLWGHSNGGQIMLSVVEIYGLMKDELGLNIRGLTLWAPVTKPFPYNILFYTDEADDKGKWLRQQIAIFESQYDVFNYSLDRYVEAINIPLQLHQGSADIEVPKIWSDEFVKVLEEKDKKIEYYVYPGADHNMRPSWQTVVARDLVWFDKLVKEEEK